MADFIPAIHRTVLPNGLTLLGVEYDRVPWVSLTFMAKRGSETDPPGKAGGHKFMARAEVPVRALPHDFLEMDPREAACWIERKIRSCRSKGEGRRVGRPEPGRFSDGDRGGQVCRASKGGRQRCSDSG